MAERFVEPLPARPNLEMQHKRAKDLLRAAWESDAGALARIRALHPKPPAPNALKLADALLVVARGYGFESWAALKQKIESLTMSPVERFMSAIRRQDVAEVRLLLEGNAEVRAAINAPIGYFDGRPAAAAKKNLALLDVLLQYGADLNLKSAWWAGPFGILDYDCTPEEAAPLIERGANVDVFAAAHLGMFDRLRTLIEQDPSLVRARGGDGKTALHSARTVEIASYLLEQGAEIDARDVDHESTAAQYLARDPSGVARFLVDSGAWFDIFIAIALGDPALVERCLRDDANALDHRTGQGEYKVGHDGARPAPSERIRRGDIYRWVFEHNVTALDVAKSIGDEKILNLLLAHASPAQRLLAACSHGERVSAESVAAANPDIVRRLTPEQMKLIAYKAYGNDTAAVTLMLDLGFDALVKGPEDWEPIRWAAFHGNATLVKRLLAHNPPIGVPDVRYEGTPLGMCIYGSLHGWSCKTGEFASTARLLLNAGERPKPSDLPTGRDDVDAVLREYLAREARSPS